MFDTESLENLGKELHTALSHPLLSYRQNKVKIIADRYRKQFEWFASLAIQSKIKMSVSPLYNINSSLDFRKDIGNILYFNFSENNKELKAHLSKLPFNIQKLLSVIISGKLVKSLSEEFLLSNIEQFVPMAEIMLDVDIPDFLDSSEYEVCSLARNKTEPSTFPMKAIHIPKSVSSKKIAYLIKDGNKIVSNITSHKVRSSLLEVFSFTKVGVIGFMSKIKGYKHRYGFVPVLYSEDPIAIKKLYVGDGFSENISVPALGVLQVPPEILPVRFDKVFAVKSKNDFDNIPVKDKANLLFVSKEALGFFKPVQKFESAKIMDWLLDDDYNVVGVYVENDGEITPIKFNVKNTDIVVGGIKDRFITIRKTYIGDKCVKIEFGGVKPVWHTKWGHCKICGGVEAKHYSNGVCNSCVHRLRRVSEYVVDVVELNFNSVDDFCIVVSGVEYSKEGENIVGKLLEGFKRQLILPFEEYKASF
jgi:hypothetical protein